jgi:hypothetical protein
MQTWVVYGASVLIVIASLAPMLTIDW